MKLQRAIIEGRFCGLETVEECYTNAYLHMMQIFPYEDIPLEQFELDQEMAAYEADYGAIDWEVVDREVAKATKEYEEWLEKSQFEEMNEFPF